MTLAQNLVKAGMSVTSTCKLLTPSKANELWSLDIIEDTISKDGVRRRKLVKHFPITSFL